VTVAEPKAPTKAQIKELFAAHESATATEERNLRAYGLDVSRQWVGDGGYRLSDSVWNARKATRAQIDLVLRRAITDGTDALVVADLLEASLLPELQPTRITPGGAIVANQRRGIVTQAPNVKEYAGSLRPFSGSYPARRLARTEITRAHGAATIFAAERTPGSIGVKWSTSGRHPKPDECDEKASRDSGLGEGVYPPKDVPQYPSHPMCLCHLSQATTDDVDGLVEGLREQYGLGVDEDAMPFSLRSKLEARGLTVETGRLDYDDNGNPFIRPGTQPSPEHLEEMLRAFDGALDRYDAYGIRVGLDVTSSSGGPSRKFGQGKLRVYRGEESDLTGASNYGNEIVVNTNSHARSGFERHFADAQREIQRGDGLPTFAQANYEDVMIHELSHGLHKNLTEAEQRAWFKRYQNTYDNDIDLLHVPSSYALENDSEYWAEGVTRLVSKSFGEWMHADRPALEKLLRKFRSDE